MIVKIRISFLLLLIFSCWATCLWAQVYPQDFIKLPAGLQSWLDYEQTLNDKSVDPYILQNPKQTEQLLAYRPENRAWFELKSIWVPAEQLNVAEIPGSAFDNKTFVKEVGGQRFYRLLIHPESEQFYGELLDKYPLAETFYATSTASSRTVLATDKKGKFFFAKLSLDINIANSSRTIPAGEVARSVGVTKYTDNMLVDEHFKIIREPLGIVPKGWARGGQLLREIPESVLKNQNAMLPFFSLYARNADGVSILQKMIEQSGEEPEQFIVERILRPFACAWSDWAVEGPIVMEAHAQNVLLELNREGLPSGSFFHRDMGGFTLNGNVSMVRTSGLPYFNSLDGDYYLRNINNAMTSSLESYFEGGIIYNLDRELAYITQKRNRHRLQAQFRQMIMDRFKSRYPGSISSRITTENLYQKLHQIVSRAREDYLRKAGCWQFLRFFTL